MANGVIPTAATETVTPPAAPTQPDGQANWFEGIWGKVKGFFSSFKMDGGGMAGGLLGAVGGWLLASMFGPGGFLSTIVMICFIPIGLFIGNQKLGPLINGWFGGQDTPGAGADAPPPLGASPGRGQTPDSPDRDITALHDAHNRRHPRVIIHPRVTMGGDSGLPPPPPPPGYRGELERG